MALPSQSAQPARRRIHMDRRPRHARRTLLVAAVGVLVVIAMVRVVMVNRAEDDPDTLASEMPVVAMSKPIETPVTRPSKTVMKPAPIAHTEPLAARVEPAPPPRPAAAKQSPRTPAPSAQRVTAGLALAQNNKPVEARRVLSEALRSGRLNPADAEVVRETIAILNRRLVFSPQVVADDPFVALHVVGPGEQLAGIVGDRSLDVDWRFILRINNLRSERHLRAGQRLKLITGPFHAVVDKSDYRMDLYLGSGNAAVYVTSLAVGLGSHDSTPLGRFRIRPDTKIENPAWANPRTGELFGSDDPANPIGEYWIGLQGIDDATRDMDGYGIHGTIAPDSIGRQASMGCIRLLPEDVRLVFEVLTNSSTIEITP